MIKSIFKCDMTGEIIRLDEPDYPLLYGVIKKAICKTAELNNLVVDDLEKSMTYLVN